MQFALFTSGEYMHWERLLDLWVYAEAAGWDAIFIDDHFMPDKPDPVGDFLECWTALAALSQQTRKARIGSMVTGNPYRHPAVLAKMAANVDIMSDGRLIFGLGAGWQENEHVAYGIPYYSVRERMDRLDEACELIQSLWTQERTDFSGQYYQLRDAPLSPKPLQKPYPEFLIGGGGVKRTLRIVAKYADHWNDWGGPESMTAKARHLEGHCQDVGRDPADIRRSACMALARTADPESDREVLRTVQDILGYPEARARDLTLSGSIAQMQDKIGRLEDAGVDMICIPTFMRELSREELQAFLEQAAAPFR
jgi:F420-dependent oxidoreductase-like protein